MIDGRNRLVFTVLAVVLVAGAALAICAGADVFGTSNAHQAIVDHTVTRWWHRGGWVSYAVVDAAGVVLVAAGVALAVGQLRRNDGRHHLSEVRYDHRGDQRGATTLRASAASHILADDLEAIPDVHDARVGLFGSYPTVELRAVLTVGDDVDLDALPARVEAALGRLAGTTDVRPDPIQITLRFKRRDRQRQLA